MDGAPTGVGACMRGVGFSSSIGSVFVSTEASTIDSQKRYPRQDMSNWHMWSHDVSVNTWLSGIERQFDILVFSATVELLSGSVSTTSIL